MGAFAWWVVARATPEQLRAWSFDPGEQSVVSGWSYGRGAGMLERDELEERAAGVARTVGGGALAGLVFDSDVGYVVAAAPEGVAASVCVNEASAVATFEVRPAPDAQAAQAASFAAWSREHAPSAVDAGTVRELLGREWVFAEEGVAELFASVGLELPSEAEAAVQEPASDDDQTALDAYRESGRRARREALEALEALEAQVVSARRWASSARPLTRSLPPDHEQALGVYDFLLVEDDPNTFTLYGVFADQVWPVVSAGSRDTVSEYLARGWDEVAEWSAVPDDVPRNLLATLHWIRDEHP